MALHTIVEHDTTHIKPYIDNVKQALSNEAEVRAELGAHNSLPFDLDYMKANNTTGTWSGNVYTLRNVTFTVNDDGTISTSGTPDELITFNYYKFSSWVKNPLKILSGCPSGGSLTNGYCLRAIKAGTFSRNDEGNGVLLDQDYTGATDITITVQPSTNMTGLTFYPMIRDARDTSSVYGQFSKTNVELTQGLSEVQDLVLDQGGITTKSFSPVIAVNDALPVNAVDVQCKIEPIQAGSGTPSPTNVRAISGRDVITATRAGKNLVEETLVRSNVNSAGTIIVNDNSYDLHIAKVKKGCTYSLISGTAFVYAFFTSKPTTGSESYDGSRIVVDGTHPTFTAPIDGYIAFRTANGYSTPQLEVGSTTTAYEAPNVNDYTIQLGDTYYGGTLDVTTGVLTVDMGIVDLGDLTYTYDSTYSRFITGYVPNMKIAADRRILKMFCSCYECISDGRALSNVPNNSVYNAGLDAKIYIHDSRYTDPSDLKTALTGQKLVYPIGTPSAIIQLTPQEIQLLQGNNTIFADSGDTSVSYYANGVKNLETVVAKMQTEADGAMHNQFQNGAVNLFENKASSVSHSSVTAIVNNDKTITVNGAPSSNFVLQLGTIILDSTKKYKLSGCPKNQPTNTQLRFTDNGGNNYFDYGDGVEFTGASSGTVYLICYSATGNTFKNAVFKPMITYADVPNSDYAHYVPFAKSNRQLTELGIKSKEITMTTNANGNGMISTSDIPLTAIILSASIISGTNYGGIAVPYLSTGNNTHAIHAWGIDSTTLANTQLTVKVYYVDKI